MRFWTDASDSASDADWCSIVPIGSHNHLTLNFACLFYVVFLFCMFALSTLRLTRASQPTLMDARLFLIKEFYYYYYYSNYYILVVFTVHTVKWNISIYLFIYLPTDLSKLQ